MVNNIKTRTNYLQQYRTATEEPFSERVNQVGLPFPIVARTTNLLLKPINRFSEIHNRPSAEDSNAR